MDKTPHSIHIAVCASLGWKGDFDHYRVWLESNFPELLGNVTIVNYPPRPTIVLLLKVMSFLQLCGIVFAMVGASVFRLVGFSYVPTWYPSVEKNAVPIGIAIYLVLPHTLSKYLETGAFEIIMDDGVTIFSKLATGRLPQMDDLVNPLVGVGLVYAGAKS
jgi:selT/selW/selH-like putative selenoprotein